ncbi:MAG: tyrosine--tRNA ligase, partial [Bdellovibrionaceae bacterium]|nr:tyrosine--tRNA ligase [Pseudobdellovibrionaceae bacterium]
FEISKLKEEVAQGSKHPRQVKVDLAKFLVARFHSQAESQNAEEEFNRIFVQKGLPDQVEEKRVTSVLQQPLNQLMTAWGLSQTNSEAVRLIEGGGVSIDNEKVTNSKLKLDLMSGNSFIIKAGKKKFLKVIVE